MSPGTEPKSRIPTPSPAPIPTVSPLGFFVLRSLRLELHLRQRRSQRLRFALRCGQRHNDSERHCQARGTADKVTAINHFSTSLLLEGAILALNAAVLIQFHRMSVRDPSKFQ